MVDPRSIELTAHSLFVVRISEILANFRSHFVVIISEILAHFRSRLADGFQSREPLLRSLSLLGDHLRGAGLVRQNQTFAEIEVARWVVFVARWVFFVALESCAPNLGIYGNRGNSAVLWNSWAVLWKSSIGRGWVVFGALGAYGATRDS